MKMKMLPIISLILAAFLAGAGPVHAGYELDGKAVFCEEDLDGPAYGLVFAGGDVIKYALQGYSKHALYRATYFLKGSRAVIWQQPDENSYDHLNRVTLLHATPGTKPGSSRLCKVSTETGVYKELDAVIEAAKKQNKI